MGVKATFQQHFPKEGPVHSIIGFMEIDLEEDRTEVFALNLMDNLMEGKNPSKIYLPFVKADWFG